MSEGWECAHCRCRMPEAGFCPHCSKSQEEEIRSDKSSDHTTEQHQQPHSETDECNSARNTPESQDEQKVVGEEREKLDVEERISCTKRDEFSFSRPDELSISHKVNNHLLEGPQSGDKVNDDDELRNIVATSAVEFNSVPSEHFDTVENQSESACESKEEPGQSSCVAPQVDQQVTGAPQQPPKPEDEVESPTKVSGVPEQGDSEESQPITLANNSSLDMDKPPKSEDKLESPTKVSGVPEQGDSEESQPTTLANNSPLDMDRQETAKVVGQSTITEGLKQEIESESMETHKGHSDSGSTITTMNATAVSEIAGGRSGLEGDSDGGDRPRETCVHLSGNEDSREQSSVKSRAGSSETIFNYRTAPKLHPKLRGLNPPDDKLLKLVFHVLVHQPVWEWDAESQLCIRFGNPELGSFKCDCGPFKVGRKLNDELCEMIGEVIIHSDLLKHQRKLSYKYTVFSPKAKVEDDCYEYLYDYGGSGNVNRCLQLSLQQYSEHQGTIQHYDTIAYPRNTKTATLYQRTFGKIIKKFWPGSQQSEEDKEEEFYTLKLPEMCDLCLKFYLEDYYKTLSECSFSPDEFSIPVVVKEIGSVYYSMQFPLAIQQGDKHVRKPQSQLPQRMKEWLESVLLNLKGIPDESRKLLSAVTIACCFYNFIAQYSKLDMFAISVLEMLQLKPNMGRCPNYELLCNALLMPMVSRNVRGEAADSIHHLITYLMKSRQFKSPEWLAAIPIFHFLKGYSQPFQKPELNPEKISWDMRVELDAVRSKPGFVEAYFSRMQPLFILDPLFLQAFIYLTPQKDLPVLFRKIPPYLSAAWLSQKANKMQSLSKDEAHEWTDWLCLLKKLTVQPSSEDGNVRLLSMAEASLLLCRKLAVKLTSPAKHYVEVFGASISLLFFAIHAVAASAFEEKIKVVLDTLKLILWKWITSREVIGGSFFGSNTQLLLAEEEVQLWQILLVVECPSPQSAKLWHTITESFILKRTRAVVPERLKIDLVGLLGAHGNLHPILTEAFMEAGMQALDSIFSKVGSYSSEEFEKLASTECARVGNLLGAMMKNQYPHLNPGLENVSVSFDELLQWNLWPNFIKLYETGSKLKVGLPQECRETCVCAVSKMQQVCSELVSGEITMKELQKIKDNLEPMHRLCAAATYQRRRSEKAAVSSALCQRLEEFEMFEKHRVRLCHLCNELHIGIQGLDGVKQELEIDFSTIMIRTVCTREQSGKIQIRYFQSAEPLNTFAEMFYIMTHTYTSDVFRNVWNSVAAKVTRNSTITIADVYPNIWQLAFFHCQTLLDQLHDQSMTLVDVDRYFKQYQGLELESQLMSMFQGINACLRQKHSGAWIKSTARRIHDYWDLHSYQVAANTFLQLRSALHLTGDFRNVERLSTEVAISMKDQTLQAVNENLIKTGQFLEDVTLNPGKLQCLQTFARCHEVIEWIQEVTKNVSELQTFVNVALSTAVGGEDDFACDRLSNLRTVGSGFGCLIYNLPKRAGYHELVQQCMLLWDAIQKNPLLPQMLEGCSDALEWYKSVKDTQGSVEVTSFGKLRHILTYGHFHIGSQSSRAVQSIHEIIHLKLQRTDKPLPKMSYSLDDLRDLESKLVLITGSKSKNRKEVDQFLNTLHSVCRIADVLMALQQAGIVKYTGWVLTFSCLPDRFQRLQALARDMETELQKWKDEIKEARERFYELNNYTVLQLLSLRSELGKLKGPVAHASVIKPATLSLLHGISPEITTFDVVKKMSTVLQQQKRAKHTVGADLASPSYSKVLKTQALAASDAHTVTDRGKIRKQESASLDAKHSSASVPPPTVSLQAKLTRAELNDRQREIFANLVDYCEYPSQLVLLAIEQFGEDEYEMKTWCFENAGKFEYQEEEEAPEQEASSTGWDTESASTESESDEDINLHFSATASGGILETETSPQFSITTRQPINESHPDVQSLMEAGFTAEQSIEAIEQHDSVAAAMDYLMSSGKGELFQPTVDLGQKTSLKTCQRRRETMECSEDKGLIVYCDESAEMEYLSLPVLGAVLQELSKFPTAIVSKRAFPKVLKAGQPNLLVTFPENVLKTTLSLYMEGKNPPLPTHEEVLICHPSTTAEEVILLWQRAFGDPGFKRIFCLVHAEKLSYQVCDKALRILAELAHGRADYRLVVICSNKDEQTSSVISKLQLFRRQYTAFANVQKFQSYLKFHFTREVQSSHSHSDAVAASVDCEHLRVRVVLSRRSGMGKSLYIRRMTGKLKSQKLKQIDHVTIPIHGPVVSPDTVLEFLSQYDYDANSQHTIFHFDIAPGVLWKVDCILFCLLVLRGLSDSKGRLWRCHPSQLYAIEVTLPEIQDKSLVIPVSRTLAFLELLPSVECVSPRRALELMAAKKEDNSIVLMDQGEFKSTTFQRVYQYLQRHIRGVNLDLFSFANTVEGNKADCLKIILHYCGIQDPSWSEVLHFVRFLDLQLSSCEESVYCDQALVGNDLPGLKGFVVRFMIHMSRDFATSSLHGVVTSEDGGKRPEVEGELQQYEIVKRRSWENSSHPYIFFNQDRITITFVGFTVTPSGDLIDPTHRGILEAAIVSTQLYEGLNRNKVYFNEDYRKWTKTAMIQKIGTVIGLDLRSMKDPDRSYVLTVDNLIKILAIQMRFRCGIPVVIMGETGCGKTRLIRYMCDLAKQGKRIQKNMLIMKVHGGIVEKDVIEFIERAEQQAVKNRKANLDTVVFFDEANTTEAIGLIKEVVCDRRLNGMPLSPDLKFIAACNPYRKHTDDMIEKLESAGLGFHVRDTQQRLGQIPLRHLVYRVLDLPPSLRPLVYDFGQLNKGTERDYIVQIVSDHVKGYCGLPQPYVVPIANVMVWSHQYMRKRQDECSFVSLRDVKRAVIVMEFFLNKVFKMAFFLRAMDKKAAESISLQQGDEDEFLHIPVTSDNVTRSLVLALSVCYCARLQDRAEYEEGVAQEFKPPLYLSEGAEQFRNEIRWCQEVLLDNVTLGPNIARNTALRENVFMMIVCIELRIPLFLVGKPGSSKSLAKAIIATSLQGKTSSNDMLKGFKQVHMFSYQCSQLSTPESVIEVFNTAKKFQEHQDTTTYVSVVVLDEVGLAEDSPNLPLKALHPLLEDGTEGAEDSEGVIDREKRVAFIGISNWALDPAKMNRGVMVTRQDPDVLELELSAQGICSYKENDPVRERLEGYFRPLAEAYKAICEQQKREFFGLRDFYSLIKMLYWLCEKTDRYPTWPQLEHVIRRNFGGLEDEGFVPLEEFRKRMPNREIPDLSLIPPELHPIMNPDSSPLGLIKTSLTTKEISWHGENRYLLFLTENYAALEILRHYLHDVVGSAFPGDPVWEEEGRPERMDPFILFGSSFPKDKEYTQVCRNINQIKICMETGRTAILLNLENLYESLYDLLNQYYIYHGGCRYVDLGLQTHRVKCRVHDNFKLILIAEKTTVYDNYPTPLINRLEKHFVLTSSVLTKWQLEVMEQLQEWAQAFSCVSGFKARNAFIGYQKDTPATVVFQATNQLQHLQKTRQGQRKWEGLEQVTILGDIQLDELMEEVEGSTVWKQAVFQLSQCLLLQTASPDAFARLKYTRLADQQELLWRLYDEVQHHTSLRDFLMHHVVQRSSEGGLLLQVTTHSHLLSGEEVEQLGDILGYREHMSWFLLQEFDTELDFSNKVSPIFQRDQSNANDYLLILQCDSGHLDGDLIACARYRIYDERANSMMQSGVTKQGRATHVLFVIHLPQQAVSSSFVGFQGDPWISAHIDDIRYRDDAVTLREAMKMPISHLFISFDDEHKCEEFPATTATTVQGESSVDQLQTGFPETECSLLGSDLEHPVDPQPKTKLPHRRGYFLHLHDCIQAAASRLQDSAKNKERATDRVKLLVDLIPRASAVTIDDSTFHGILILHIYELLKERDRALEDERNWVVNEALSSKKLQSGGTFQNVIARKLDQVIIPLFAEIIAMIDRSYNLDLVDPSVPVFQLWLAIFRDCRVMQFIYTEMVVRELVPGAGGRMAEEDFWCQLPFSWLVWETYEAQLDTAKSIAGDNWGQLYTQLCVLVSETPIGEVLEAVDETSCEPFYQRYLHDFVRSVHKCSHRKPEYAEMEYGLIAKALSGIVHSTEVFSSIRGHESLTCRIAALHVVHQPHRSHILWFGLLASHMPGVLVTLEQRLPTDSEEMLLHLYAVERALEILTPKAALKKDDPAVHDWLNLLRLSQNAIAPILNLPSQHEIAWKARLQWQLIHVLQMFIEHIVSKYDGMEKYAKRLEMYLKSDPDFLKCSTIDKVKKHLNLMDGELRKKLKDKPKKLASILRSSQAFFTEVISTLCFGATDPPEEQLIQMLISTIFTETHEVESEELGTRDFNYREIASDRIPTIRSFLLQLLLEHDSELVKDHLGDYFRRSQQALASVNAADRDLYLLYTQCFEDSLYKRFTTKNFQDRLSTATVMLQEAHGAFQISSYSQGDALLYVLEGVAKARYGLSVVAVLLNEQISERAGSQHHHGIIVQQLLQVAKALCTDEGINHIDVIGDSDTTGPIVYLLKLLVRHYGTHCLQHVSEIYQWTLPRELVHVYQAEHTKDPFLLYGQPYSKLRQCVTAAAIGKYFKQLSEAVETLAPQDVPLLLLALYESITLSRADSARSRQVQPDVLDEVGKVFTKSKILSRELKWMSRALLSNEQGGPLAQLTVTPRQTLLQQTLGAVVVHTAAALLCRQGVDLLRPFINMLLNPAALVNTYLPTMPEDPLPEAQMALPGAFYECPRGHPYLVTECGNPTQQYKCPVCGSQIGGNHTLEHDNRIARRDDLTQTGHCLGQANSCSSVPAPERSLSPVACCILRALMHSALLWASCNYQTVIEGLLGLVKPRLRSAELPEFFWFHLERDLKLLGQATGKSMDEAAIILHLVLRGILTQRDTVHVVNILDTRNARDKWENVFKKVFIQPVLERMEENVAAVLDLIINDNKEDHLLYLVYEKTPVKEGSLIPHLWTYRSRITLEHLSQTLQQQGMRKQYPILYHFLKEEHILRAMQYLPDIVRLQRLLYDSFHHRLDRSDAKHNTIGQFLSERKSESVRNDYRRMVESLQKAWQLVGDQLRDHARLRIDDDHLIPAFTEDTPLEYLVPTTTGAGACTTALVDFLVLTHNNFIEKCRGIVTDQEKRLSKFPLAWQNHPVLLPHVHRCHLLDYENQLHSVILSYCQYSLVVGSGQKISYDWPALEKHILGRFIHGKPLLQSEIPQVVYKKDIYTAATFDAIRKKVKPQVQLDSRIKHEIVHELHSVSRVREALDVVDIVMGFLSSGGGRADQQLGDYITRTLRMSKKKRFSEKARKHCTLGHILSLWETLSVELARQLVLSGQDPFDSIKEEFSKELVIKGEQSQTRALDHCLRSFNLSQLLEALYVLIETHIKYCPDNEKDWQLVDVLDAFLENNHLVPIPHFANEFPNNVTLSQTVAVWKHIVLYTV